MKRSITLLVLMVLAAGVLFAQTQEEAVNEYRPMNTLTVDLGPLIGGLGMGIALNNYLDGGSGFGIGAQYERQIVPRFSAGARFAYLLAGLEVKTPIAPATIDMTSFSIEGHGRFYPFAGAFFLDALLGYANYKADLSVDHKSYTSNLDYFKLGGKLGWRIDFGRPGGFVFEPSIGYSVGVEIGGSKFGTITSGTGIKEIEDKVKDIAGNVDDLNKMLGDFVFVGGPKISLAVGWRF